MAKIIPYGTSKSPPFFLYAHKLPYVTSLDSNSALDQLQEIFFGQISVTHFFMHHFFLALLTLPPFCCFAVWRYASTLQRAILIGIFGFLTPPFYIFWWGSKLFSRLLGCLRCCKKHSDKRGGIFRFDIQGVASKFAAVSRIEILQKYFITTFVSFFVIENSWSPKKGTLSKGFWVFHNSRAST